MLRLLIVDDEPYTVDGLYEMIEETKGKELELFVAYSAEEALKHLDQVRIDIVLSDIRMPGMNGLEMQSVIMERWPRCKVIFLTGHDDLQYVQKAVRSGAVNYILKTEGDEEIVRSIEACIASLMEESLNEQILKQAKDHLQMALPMLRKEWFFELQSRKDAKRSVSKERFAELEVPLLHDEPVLLAIGRVDRWQEQLSQVDRALLTYAVQNIASEYYAQQRFLFIRTDDSHFVWLVQPKPKAVNSLEKGDMWKQASVFVKEMIDPIQRTCGNLLGLSLSLILSASPMTWDDVGVNYNAMFKSLMLGIGGGDSMLLTFDAASHHEPVSTSILRREQIRESLHLFLEKGRKDEFLQTYDEFIQEQKENIRTYSGFVEIYYHLALLLLSYLNQSGLGAPVDLDQLMNVSSHLSKEQAFSFLRTVSERLFSERQGVQDDHTNRVIDKINNYIQQHLDNELSLTQLADLIHVNPSYLSVLYKKAMGRNLSDYIAELRVKRAKELLLRTPLKVHEVGLQVGFVSPGYFIRFFKKYTNLTPQEFRNENS